MEAYQTKRAKNREARRLFTITPERVTTCSSAVIVSDITTTPSTSILICHLLVRLYHLLVLLYHLYNLLVLLYNLLVLLYHLLVLLYNLLVLLYHLLVLLYLNS